MSQRGPMLQHSLPNLYGSDHNRSRVEQNNLYHDSSEKIMKHAPKLDNTFIMSKERKNQKSVRKIYTPRSQRNSARSSKSPTPSAKRRSFSGRRQILHNFQSTRIIQNDLNLKQPPLPNALNVNYSDIKFAKIKQNYSNSHVREHSSKTRLPNIAQINKLKKAYYMNEEYMPK